MTTFQRARSPEQIEQRRLEILEAAAALFTDHDYDAVSLQAIAGRAGLAKSALYRYFETKEEIFLQLYLEDLRKWIVAVELALAPHPGCNDPGRVARALTRNLLRHPRLASLQALLSGVLERNVSVESVAAFKMAVIEPTSRLAIAVAAALPALTPTQLNRFLIYLHAISAGLWPMAHHGPALEEVLNRPEIAPMRTDFGRDLTGALEAILHGFLAGAGRSEGEKGESSHE
jgi:AcrR family transcriptional regulator